MQLQELRLLRQAQAISRVGSWSYDSGLRRLWLSATACDLLGLTGDPAAGYARVRVEAVRARIDRTDWARLRSAIAVAIATEGAIGSRLRISGRTTAGPRRSSFLVHVAAPTDFEGLRPILSGTIADAGAQDRTRAAHAALSIEHRHQQAVIEATPDAIHVYDVATGTLVRGNRSGKPLIGFTAEMEAVLGGLRLDALVPPHDRHELERLFVQALELADGGVVQVRHRVTHADGHERWLSRSVTPFDRTETGLITELLVISRDVSDVVAVELRLERAALHDELTGLANRRLAHERLEHSLRSTVRGGHVAVLVCDLDGFKRINDAYGHLVGDAVLVESAARMSGAVRPADTIGRLGRDPLDTIARMGGDEFTVILDIAQPDDPAQVAQQVAQRVATALALPFCADGREHRISVSIGIAIADDNAGAESLLNDADAAMYHIKTRGGNGYACYEPGHRADTAADDELEHHIRRALVASDRIEVHYQPVIDPHTDRIQGVEALLRLRDDTGRFLDAAAVVAVAERTGLIAAIDARVLDLACAQAVAWRRRPELAHLVLAVNRSVRDITRAGFYDRIADALRRSGLEPAALTLEITETVLLDAGPADLADLRALRELGIGLAIDDFGTGYASLRYLAELPISGIKIDRSFTNRLPDDATAITLVRTTISLAEQLGINCVVEGVETTDQLAALPPYRRLLIQGYLYARPQSAAEPLPVHFAPRPAASRDRAAVA